MAYKALGKLDSTYWSKGGGGSRAPCSPRPYPLLFLPRMLHQAPFKAWLKAISSGKPPAISQAAQTEA